IPMRDRKILFPDAMAVSSAIASSSLSPAGSPSGSLLRICSGTAVRIKSSSDSAPRSESICSDSDSVGPMCRRANARDGTSLLTLLLTSLLPDQSHVVLRAEERARVVLPIEPHLDNPARPVRLLIDELGGLVQICVDADDFPRNGRE